LAQNVQPRCGSRNRDWIARRIGRTPHAPLAQVIKQEALPPGRWREKAYAAAAVEFLFPEGDLNAWAPLFQGHRTRQAIDAAWLRDHCAALKDAQPEKAWAAFLEKKTRVRNAEAWSDRGLQIEEKLLQTLNFRPRDVAADVPPEVPQDLFARDLIDHRAQPWVAPLAAALKLQVQSLELGAPLALRDVLASYAAFFEQLGLPPAEKSAWWKRAKKEDGKNRPPNDATWQIALNQLWMRAERAHQAFLENNQSRKRYVDSFDAPGMDDFADSPAVADGPRTRYPAVPGRFRNRESR
jgi:hypothetical protein